MVLVTIDIDLSELSGAFERYPEAQILGMEYAAEEMVRVLMMNSPVDHGLLKSWFISSLDENEAHIQTPAEYALYVNEGTRPHVIEPVSAQALYWPGADHPVKRVNHPGTQGQHFIENSIDDVEGRLAGYFLQALREVMG